MVIVSVGCISGMGIGDGRTMAGGVRHIIITVIDMGMRTVTIAAIIPVPETAIMLGAIKRKNSSPTISIGGETLAYERLLIVLDGRHL